MKRYIIMLMVMSMTLMTALSVMAEDKSLWGNDFALAKKEAAKKEVPILVFFTGSDWCGWCIKLNSEVLSKKAFQDFAEENFVLFEADFPRRKKLPEKVAAQNRLLQQKYKIRGFPTLLVLNAEGKELARTGYRRGGAEAYVKHLKKISP